MQTRAIFVIRWVALLGVTMVLFACSAPSPSASQPAPLTTVPTTAPASTTPEPPSPTIAPTATTAPAGPQALFLTADRQIVAWDTATQSTQVVTKLPADVDLYTIALAPNGQAVAYVSPRKLFIRDLASGADIDITPAKFTGDLSGNINLFSIPFAWSPDSTKLLFSLGNPWGEIPSTIYIASRDGQPPHALTPGFGAAWSPGNDRIVYAGPPFVAHRASGGGGDGGMFSIINPGEAAGHGFTGVDSDLDTFFPEWQPVHWSADGSRVAVGTGIYDTATSKLVLRVPEGAYYVAIQYLSADGRAYGLWRSIPINTNERMTLRDEIVIVGADGTTRVIMQSPEMESDNCLTPLLRLLDATWNGDGSAILVTEHVACNKPGVSEMRLYDGNGKLMWGVPLPPTSALYHAIWSPDGSAALLEDWGDPASVLLKNRDGSPPNVVIVSRDGGKPQPIGAGSALGWRKR